MSTEPNADHMMPWEVAYQTHVQRVRETGEGYTEPEMFRAGYEAGYDEGYNDGVDDCD